MKDMKSIVKEYKRLMKLADPKAVAKGYAPMYNYCKAYQPDLAEMVSNCEFSLEETLWCKRNYIENYYTEAEFNGVVDALKRFIKMYKNA